MKYPTGEAVQVGDEVNLSDDLGMVVCVIDDGQYSVAYPNSEWSYLKRGVLINFSKHGLMHYEMDVELDVKLVRRAISGS